MSTVIKDETAKKLFAFNMSRAMEIATVSQADLARITGESEMRISNYRRGLKLPSIAMAARIAEALDVSLDILLKENATAGDK